MTEDELDNQEETSIRVLIVDDHPMVRAGARAMLNTPGIEIIGEAGRGDQAVAMTVELKPDVVLMDIQLPDMDGVHATAAIKEQAPEVAVIVVTGSESREHIRGAVEAGASGYILKGAPREMLIQAVRMVQAGGSLIDASMLAALAEDANAEADEGGLTEVARLMASLSPRELQVLGYLARGMTNKEIAGEMHYSVGTVKNVVQRIIEKLGVSDRTQAAVYAVRAGLDVD
ncbi:MAG TPA: response regulator transcription factor [Dehalococcoidia bacterium]|nr:response regulator transcription factor [Dehalococcoidia bacterium]